MAGDTYLAGQGDVVADRGAAGYPHLGDNHAVAPDLAVVGDLHQVVELGALLYQGRLQGGPVDGRIGADLHIVLKHHDADLGNTVVTATVRASQPNPSLPMTAPGWKDHPVAEAATLADHRIGVHHTVIADHCPLVNDGAAMDDGAVADGNAVPDTGAGIDADPVPQRHAGSHVCPGQYPQRRMRGPCGRSVRSLANPGYGLATWRSRCGRKLSPPGAISTAPAFVCATFGGVFGVCQKRYRVGSGSFQGG